MLIAETKTLCYIAWQGIWSTPRSICFSFFAASACSERQSQWLRILSCLPSEWGVSVGDQVVEMAVDHPSLIMH